MTGSQDARARLAELHQHLAGQLAQWQDDGAPRLALGTVIVIHRFKTTPNRQRGKADDGKPARTSNRQNVTR